MDNYKKILKYVEKLQEVNDSDDRERVAVELWLHEIRKLCEGNQVNSENGNLPIFSVSGMLPNEEQTMEWVCKEFDITRLDFDEDVRMQNGYLPDVFNKFVGWIKSNYR